MKIKYGNSFLSNLLFSTARNECYWSALKHHVLGLPEIGINSERNSNKIDLEAIPDIHILWPRLFYLAAENQNLKIRKILMSILVTEKIRNAIYRLILLNGKELYSGLQIEEPNDFEIVHTDVNSVAVQNIIAGLDFIELFWTEGYKECLRVIFGIIPIASQNFENFSDPKLFGLIHLNTKPNSTPFEMAVDIVHEVAHHSLFVEQTVDQLLVEPGQLIYSPLRKTQRPAIGVLHAAVVTERILQFIRAIHSNGCESDNLLTQVTKLEEACLDDQFVMLGELKPVSRTTRGEELYRELEEKFHFHKAARTQLPRPALRGEDSIYDREQH